MGVFIRVESFELPLRLDLAVRFIGEIQVEVKGRIALAATLPVYQTLVRGANQPKLTSSS
jgi:hypothetical protein